ncbi:MAG TPA: hypothetical protein VN512_01235 [Clostridia bacterium]|nr:hypothetical protein [Clostridia bacterium]
MKQLSAVLKVYLLGFANFNVMLKTKDSKRRSRAAAMFATMLFVGLAMLGLAFSSFYGMGYVLNQLGELDKLLSVACAAASVTVFVTAVAKVMPTLFAFRDYELLMSLPMDEKTLVLSRILRLYGVNLFFMSFVLLPAGISYLMFSPQGVWFYVRFFVLLFFVPLIPLSFAAIVGTLIAFFGARFRHSNLVSLILMFAFVIGIMAVSFATPQIMEHIESISSQLGSGVTRFYPVAEWYGGAVVNGNAVQFLLFALMSALVFAAFVWAVGKNFKALVTRLSAKASMRMQKQKEHRLASPVNALYKKEIKRYLASTLYVFNTAFGAVLVVIAAVALAVVGEEKLGAALEMPGLKDVLASAAPFALAVFACMSATTPASVSIEGGKLWQLKALPVQTRDLFRAKVLVSVTVMAPALIVASTVFIFVFKADLWTAVLMYIAPLVYTLFIARVGLYVNLLIPKLDWRNEAEVIKQGAPVIVTMLIGWAASILPIMWLIDAKNNATLYGYFVLAAMAVLTVLAEVLLQKDGAKRFAQL